MHQTLVADRSHRSAGIPAERLSPFHISSRHFLVDILHQLLGVDFRKTQIDDALDTESHTHDEGDGNERHKSRITLYKLCLKSLMKSHVLFLSHHRQRTHPCENQYCKTCNSCIFLHIPYYIYKSGKRGIRTPEPVLPVTRFPGVPLQPLEHLSIFRRTLLNRRNMLLQQFRSAKLLLFLRNTITFIVFLCLFKEF